MTLTRLWGILWCASIILYSTGGGVQSQNIRANILGGNDTTLGEVTFYGAMFRKSDTYIYCGGTLIDTQWFLTAAHCVNQVNLNIPNARYREPVDPRMIGLSFGDIDRYPDTPIDAKEIFIHEKYISTLRYSNDIALIRLAKNVTLGNNTKPIKIYSGQLKENDTLQVAGIGVTSLYPMEYADKLQTLSLPIAGLEECQKITPTYADPNGPRVCAGGIKGQDTCQGDSGGPLYKTMPGNREVLVGITSIGGGFGRNGPMCGGENEVGFYTHAYYYIDWISEITGIPKDTLLDYPQTNETVSDYTRNRTLYYSNNS